MSDKPLFILDIDEVLVHSDENPLDPNFDFKLYNYKTVKRPYLDEFISCVFDWFDVAIWTASTDDYAQAIIQSIIPNPELLKFVWTRKCCRLKYDYEIGDYYWIKDLVKVKRAGYQLEKVLVIEDEPRSLQRSYGNLVTVSPFDGNPEDNELQVLVRFLDYLRNQENMRKIEKRIWRSFGQDKLALS